MNPYEILAKVREQKPLVHHITNWVTIYDCANVVRAIGALPVMAHAKEEAKDMTSISQALVLNIGTLTPQLISSMILAGKMANKKGIPVVLDAVGAGATPLRTNAVKQLMKEIRIGIIKGNSAEIAIIAGAKAEVKGVEAINVEGSPVEIAKQLAEAEKSVVVVTGKQDIVAKTEEGKNRIHLINNGHDMLGKVVGTGCMAASVIGAFAAVEQDYAEAAASALICFGIAGELAAKNSRGPGTYKERFYDEIYNLSKETVEKMARFESRF